LTAVSYSIIGKTGKNNRVVNQIKPSPVYSKSIKNSAFNKIFNKYFGDSFVLLTKDEALSERLFGTGNDRDGLEDMIGDYIALAISDKSIFITHFHTQEMRGVHAGLTEAERRIPFIVIEKK
jgi:hypothetical protein